MGFRLLTLSEEHAPARSVALITAELSEAFPHAGVRASEAASVAAVVMGGAGSDMLPAPSIRSEFKKGEEHHAA
jgi:hypothetical protein